jgi:hypothetical protein
MTVSERERALFSKLAGLFGELAVPEGQAAEDTSVVRAPAPTPATKTQQPAGDEDEELLDDEIVDGRLRSRRVYFLTAGAENRGSEVPTVPSGCRKVFKWLLRNEVGTVKMIATGLDLDRKTIANVLSALTTAKLVGLHELPKLGK